MDFLLQTNNIFKNPLKLPLNELNLEVKRFKKVKKTPKDLNLEQSVDVLQKNYDVRIEKVPALNKSWLQKDHTFNYYQPYFTELSQEDNAVFTKNHQFIESLDFLLQCSYQQFWCYIVYEPKVSKLLKSFIYNALAWYELKALNAEAFKLYSDIHQKVGQVLGRLFRFKESEIEFMSEDTTLKLIDSSAIFTFPIIMHLVLLYKNSNQNLINDIIGFYFTQSSTKVEDDLKKMVEQALQVFEIIGGQICGFEEKIDIIPLGIGPKPNGFVPGWYEDLATYLLDTAANLNAFLSVCKPSVQIALNLGLPYRLSYFYNRVYPKLYKTMEIKRDLPFDWSDMKTRILDRMAISRSEFVNCFQIFVTYFTDNIIESQGNLVKQDEYLEEYIELISTMLEYEFFIFDYHNSNPIDDQLQIITNFYPELDKMRTDYILECLCTLPNLSDLRAEQMKKTASPPKSIPEPKIEAKQEQVTNGVTPDEIENRIKHVLDMFPDLGDGFILKCLEFYNYEPAEVITAILDANLSPQLEEYSRDLIRVPPEPEPERPILAYFGKKPTYSDTRDLLNDKRDMREIKDFVLKTSQMTYDMYDDEYDDRDDREVKVHVLDDKDENPYKYMENRFEGYELVSDPSSSEDEIDVNRNKNHFCEDPALIRERREAARRQSGRGNSHDVVGRSKGQGQTKTVTQNRDKKNVQKSSRANHNRKGGAQWKRNKGMFPS